MPEHPLSKIVPPRDEHDRIEAWPHPEPYAEVQCISNFSFLRGASHPEELVKVASLLGYRALALTDWNTLAGICRLHEAAKTTNLKIIPGARVTIDDCCDILVYPRTREGYSQLCQILTLGKSRVEKGQFQLSLDEFLSLAHDVHAVMTQPHKCAGTLKDHFRDRLSLCVSHHYLSDAETHSLQLGRFVRQFQIPVVATNDVHYHDPARKPLQDVLTCIRHKTNLHEAGHLLFPNDQRYLKTPDQMHRLFADHPNWLARGIDISADCTFSLDQIRYDYPHELVPGGKSPIQHLRELTLRGARERFDVVPDRIIQLIEYELALIEQLHFEYYFLTVYDIVCYARRKNILCQGRGSAANSCVCYCLGITNVDPTQIDLLFERFISAARNEPPDIDVDFEHERREEVLQYIYSKYGRDRAAMCAEVITYRGRSAVREVGKALGLGLDQVDQMAKKLDWWHRGVLSPDQVEEAGLDPSDATIQKVLQLAAQILGFPRHLGQHVGGMVMTNSRLSDLVPIENARMDNRTIIEWDKDDIDTVGMIKVDCLGLGMLSVIARAAKMLGTDHRVLARSPTDPKVYDMMCEADTMGVFQIESRAQMSMLPRLRPRCFYDLVIEVAIVRPGPIQGDMVHPYLRRRNGQEQVSFPSKDLERVLGKTMGVPIFQEQAMKIAMVGAGFSAMEADQLRRAMAQWRKNDKIIEFKNRIINGMLANGYTQEFAGQCFNQIKGFCEYGFPESHAASFAHLVYISAWLKRYHPAAFCAALLNSQPMGFYAPAQLVRDAIDHGVTVLHPDVNHSDWDCTLEPPPINPKRPPSLRADWGLHGPTLRLGLRMIRGIDEQAMREIVTERQQQGMFVDIENLHRRTKLSKAQLAKLAQADAFGSMKLSRRPALWDTLAVDDQRSPLPQEAPGLFDESRTKLPTMLEGEEVLTDYATVGLSLKAHPMQLVRDKLTAMKIVTCQKANQMKNRSWASVGGLVLIRQRPSTASGIVFITLEDETGIVNLIVRPKLFEQFNQAARHAAILQCRGVVERSTENIVHIMAHELIDLGGVLDHPAFRSRDFH